MKKRKQSEKSPIEQAEERIKQQGGIWEEEGWVVKGNLSLYNLNLATLPEIKSVGGDFDCSYNQLTNLTGSPKSVGGDFHCGGNQLTDLIGSPKMVGGDFYCGGNQLTDLIGSPKMVGGDFYCYENPLKSLIGLPNKIGGEFWCGKGLSFPKEEIMLLIKAHPRNLEEVIKKIKWV